MLNVEPYWKTVPAASKIPGHTLGSLERYVIHHMEPGGFLKSVLSNDLFSAIARADDQNTDALVDICKFIHNYLPPNCYGSHAVVESYLKQKETV